MTMSQTRPLPDPVVPGQPPVAGDPQPAVLPSARHIDGVGPAGPEIADQAGSLGSAASPPESPSEPRSRDRLLRSLTAITAILTIAIGGLIFWLVSVTSARADEQSAAATAISGLEQDLDSANRDLADTREALGQAEAATIETGADLDRVNGKLRKLRRAFPIDLAELGTIQPTGRYKLTGEVIDCDGWKDCTDENWQKQLDRLEITCTGRCSAESDDDAEPMTLDRDTNRWAATGPYGANCQGTATESHWVLDLETAALALDDETVVIERLEGVIRYTAEATPGKCRSAEAEIRVVVGR